MIDGRIMPEHSSGGLKPLNVNSKVKKWLSKTLGSKSNIGKYKNYIVYDAAWEYLIKFASNNNLKIADHYEFKDYIKLMDKNL